MAEQEQNESADEIKRRALKRLLVAVALIVLAIAALALIERWSAPKPMPEPIAEPTIAPPLPALPESAPLAPPELGGESTPESAPVASEAPPPPVVINNEKLAPSAKPHGLPKPAAQPESSAAPSTATTKIEAPHGYVLQLGVFASPTNAEALQSRLAKAGIRAYTETRVQVGPFKDKAEAEQAMAKLRAMGLTPVIVPAR